MNLISYLIIFIVPKEIYCLVRVITIRIHTPRLIKKHDFLNLKVVNSHVYLLIMLPQNYILTKCYNSSSFFYERLNVKIIDNSGRILFQTRIKYFKGDGPDFF